MFNYDVVAVTGGFGFIGSHFVEIMTKSGKKVIILDNLTYATKYNFQDEHSHIFSKNENVEFCKCDISENEIYKVLETYKPEVIVNFAAESHVDRSLIEDDTFMKTNVFGVKNLLNFIKNSACVKRFVQVSTDEVGGAWETGSFKETDKRRPRNPYSASKGMAEMLCEAYFENFDVPVIITRGSNTYGPRQFPEKLIPLFILNLLRDKKVPIYDQGIQVRDWLHVYDHAFGVKYALEHGELGQIYHIGGDNERQNIEVINRIFKILGKPESLKDWNASRKGHDMRYSLDCTKLKDLGWVKFCENFEEELEKTVLYYKDHFDMFEI